MSGGFTPSLKRSDATLSGKASFLASEQMTVKRGGITLDASLVLADADGNKILDAGTFVAEVTASGKYGPYGGKTNEVQTATITGAPTGGTFTLTFGGFATEAIDFDATADEVQAALAALPNVDEGDVTVTKAGAVYTVVFGEEMAGRDVPALTATPSFTGGSTPGVTIATSTAGGASVSDGREAPSADDSGYLLEAVNLKDGDVITGLLIRGSVLAARVIPAPDSTIRDAVKGRILFQ